jgi:hypothetical protein
MKRLGSRKHWALNERPTTRRKISLKRR